MGAVIGFIIVLAILLGGGIAGLRYGKRIPDGNDPGFARFLRIVARVVSIAALVGAIVFVLTTCLVTVSTKNVGIETFAGRTEGHLSNGLHFIPPGYSVTEMDAAIQTDNYGEQTQGGVGAGVQQKCITIRIAFQQTACAHATIRWRIRPAAADALFQNYRTFDNVRDSLVTREFQTALNTQFENYNPLDSVSVVDAQGNTHQPKTPATVTFGVKIAAQMRREIGGQIEVLSVFTPLLSFDDATQGRINQLQQQVALTRIATQEIATNAAQTAANKKLASSVNNSPNVLVAQCFSLLEQISKKPNGSWPIGFQCWPNGSSSATGVIVNPNGASTSSTKAR